MSNNSKQEPLIQVQENGVERELKKLKQVVRINAYIASVFSLISIVVTATIFFLSSTLSSDKKIFFALILGVVGLGLLIVICVARSEPIALLIFSTLTIYVSALTLGLSITYA